MYELMSELNDRSEDLERQMLSLEQRVEQLTAGFNALPAHLSATLSAQHAALVHLLRERDARDGRGGGGGAVVPLSPAASLTTAPASVSPVQVTAPAPPSAPVSTLALESPLSPPPLSPEGSLEASSNPNTCTSSCWGQLFFLFFFFLGPGEDKYEEKQGGRTGAALVLTLQTKGEKWEMREMSGDPRKLTLQEGGRKTMRRNNGIKMEGLYEWWDMLGTLGRFTWWGKEKKNGDKMETLKGVRGRKDAKRVRNWGRENEEDERERRRNNEE